MFLLTIYNGNEENIYGFLIERNPGNVLLIAFYVDCYNSGDLLDEGGFGRVYEAARIEGSTRMFSDLMSL